MEMVKVEAKTWNPETRDWSADAVYSARNRMEAIRWINFNRSYMHSFRIDGEPVS